MVETTEEVRVVLGKHLPGIISDKHFKATSPRTNVYNCIAWAMGFIDRWVDFARMPGHWWPSGVSRDSKQTTLIEAFKAVGFEVCKDGEPQKGYEKVALYSLDGQWTHAARILSTSVYHSKMGRSWDVQHSSGDIFKGSAYGTIYCFMQRKKRKFPFNLLNR